jgi:hypothetical protein
VSKRLEDLVQLRLVKHFLEYRSAGID